MNMKCRAFNIRRAINSSLLVVALIPALGGCSETVISSIPERVITQSPFQEYREMVLGLNLSEEEQQRRADGGARWREELIAQCMNDAGFVYFPTVPQAVLFDDGTHRRPDDRDWVTQWGWGVVNSPLPVGFEEWMSESQGSPNLDYQLNLSPSELEAYNLALWGPPLEQDEDGNFIMDVAKAGCHRLAQEQVDAAGIQQLNPASIMQSEQFGPLFDGMSELWMQLEADNAYAEVLLEWSACMADAGFPGYQRQRDARGRFQAEDFSQFRDYWGGRGYVQFADGWRNPDGPNTAAFDAAYAELINREVDIALADLDCREAVGYWDRRNQITWAAEAQFVQDHREAFRALRDAVEQAG